jgi:hypothetical protein
MPFADALDRSLIHLLPHDILQAGDYQQESSDDNPGRYLGIFDVVVLVVPIFVIVF